MTHQQALTMCSIIGGEPFDSGSSQGWVIVFHHDNGRIATVSQNGVTLYDSVTDFRAEVCERSIDFRHS